MESALPIVQRLRNFRAGTLLAIPIPQGIPAKKGCKGCPEHKPCSGCGKKAVLTAMPRGLHWVSTSQLVADAIALAGSLPLNCSGVVGIPRSGMIPAAIIATHLHLPLYALEGRDLRKCWAEGSRGGGVVGYGGPLAVVDDTTFSGGAMGRVRNAMRERDAVFAAVYVNSDRATSVRAVDFYARAIPSPHILEWNVTNNWSTLAFDIDGIIVHDAESGGLLGSPYILPRRWPARLIATGRHERHRAETESLLRSLAITWQRLEMLPDHIPLTPRTAAEHKAKHFAAIPDVHFFVESCPEQAEIISRLSKKPCICPRVSRIFHFSGG
jgi:hypothetical protein